MNKLSLAMIVKNESRCLARCLSSVQKLADEIVVVDTGSADNTVEIARGFGTRLFHFDWIQDFSAARNHALDQTSGDWILVLDADETVSEPLADEIRRFIAGPRQIGRLKIVSDFKRNGQTLRSQTFVSRLFPRGARFEGKIHEQIASPLPRVNLLGPLWHDGYLETQKTDRNVTLLQAEIARDSRNAYLHYQLALEFTSLNRAQDAFASLQKARIGMRFSDPVAPNIIVDFLYAAMELKEFAAGQEVIRSFEAGLADFPDFHLVCGLFYMNLIRSNPRQFIAELPKIEASFQRCLALGETDKYKSVLGAGSFLASYNLGVFYHVFGNAAAARQSFETAARAGYEPAAKLLQQF